MRFYVQPIIEKGRRLGTIVAGVALAPYEQTRRTALIGSIGLGALLLLVVALAARWLLSSSLRPVSRMTRQAEAWSENDPDHRFGLGRPYDELTELAATLDSLLDRLSASLRHEQRFSAELSHELRLPLSRILAETELALRRERAPEEYKETIADVQRDAQQLARIVEALVAAARQEGGARGTADAYAVAGQAVEACAGLAQERHLDLSAEAPSTPLRIGIDGQLAERILQPVVENACRYSEARVRISLSRDPTRVLYTVEDDGPGLADDELERIFEPGVRGSAGSTGDGAGLGLALARRLARSASGDIEAQWSSTGGRFVIAIPTG
jgi:signal transduction histidine kinase